MGRQEPPQIERNALIGVRRKGLYGGRVIRAKPEMEQHIYLDVRLQMRRWLNVVVMTELLRISSLCAKFRHSFG